MKATFTPLPNLNLPPTYSNRPPQEFLPSQTLFRAPTITAVRRRVPERWSGGIVDPRQGGHEVKIWATLVCQVERRGSHLAVGVHQLALTAARQPPVDRDVNKWQGVDVGTAQK